MPRATIKDHLKEFEVVCTGIASTKKMAMYFLSQDIALNEYWIKGTPAHSDVSIDPIIGGYRASCTISFTDKRHATNESIN